MMSNSKDTISRIKILMENIESKPLINEWTTSCHSSKQKGCEFSNGTWIKVNGNTGDLYPSKEDFVHQTSKKGEVSIISFASDEVENIPTPGLNKFLNYWIVKSNKNLYFLLLVNPSDRLDTKDPLWSENKSTGSGVIQNWWWIENFELL